MRSFVQTVFLVFSFHSLALDATDSTEQLNFEESLGGAGQCTNGQAQVDFLQNSVTCDLLDDIDACSALNSAIYAASTNGIRQAEKYLIKRAGTLGDKIREAIINDFGNSLHSRWKENWSERVSNNPNELKAEKAHLAHYEAEGRELVTSNQGNPPRYKLDKSIDGKFFDIANLDFEDLPPAFANDNRRAAEEAVDHFFSVYRTNPDDIEFPKTRADWGDPNKMAKLDKMSEAFHQQWLAANRDFPWVTGDPALENRIKDEKGIPRRQRLLKRDVSAEEWKQIRQNRALISKWKKLNLPYSKLPPDIIKLNREMVTELADIFESRYANKMGKGVALLRAGAKRGTKNLILKATGKWGAWRLASYPLAFVSMLADAKPLNCGSDLASSYMTLSANCQRRYEISDRVLNFLMLPAEEQAQLLKTSSDLCDYLKKLSNEVLKDRLHQFEKGNLPSQVTCLGGDSFQIQDDGRRERVQYIMDGTKLKEMRIESFGESSTIYRARMDDQGRMTVDRIVNGQTVLSLPEDMTYRDQRPDYNTNGVFYEEGNSSLLSTGDVVVRARAAQVSVDQVGDCCRRKVRGTTVSRCVERHKREMYGVQ